MSLSHSMLSGSISNTEINEELRSGLSGKKILIHNEPNMQDVIQACLTTFAGWNVRVANSTLEGVPQAILSQPEAIIVEVCLGEIDGLRFLKKLRTPPATQ